MISDKSHPNDLLQMVALQKKVDGFEKRPITVIRRRRLYAMMEVRGRLKDVALMRWATRFSWCAEPAYSTGIVVTSLASRPYCRRGSTRALSGGKSGCGARRR